ncbi:MAG: peptide chain release factor N(5)-glutamine methyltransferase [Gammaproteobacteria bacterium]|nr:peptide chain release factor N(5)-glutamine methyltransferase [Gammaproteobacteria bacterium]
MPQEQTTTIALALELAIEKLADIPDTIPRLEAEVLLSSLLDKPRTYLVAWPEMQLSPEQTESFISMLERRTTHEPIAYITGYREFWSLNFEVTPDTLIPRPETETLVELTLEHIPHGIPLNIADLGTGSGVIAAAIASERPQCSILATDLSPSTLRVAERNFHRLGLNNIQTALGEWCHALPPGKPFDIIISNPPYVAEGDGHLAQNGLPWEPQLALRSGDDGLDDISRIITCTPNHITSGGWLILEHGFDQGERVRSLLEQAGFSAIHTSHDLSGHDRVTAGRRE